MKKVGGIALAGALVVAVIVVLSSGGSSARPDVVSPSSEEKACVINNDGVKSRIRPESSGLPCTSIQMILVVLSNQPGVSPLYDENGEPSWVCREYPKSALPREIRCHEGKRHFERVRIRERAGG
jgi:hypothetical protein